MNMDPNLPQMMINLSKILLHHLSLGSPSTHKTPHPDIPSHVWTHTYPRV